MTASMHVMRSQRRRRARPRCLAAPFVLAVLACFVAACTLHASAPPLLSQRKIDIQAVVEPGATTTRCTRKPKTLAACFDGLDERLREAVQDLLKLYVAPRSESSPRYPARIEIRELGHLVDTTPEPPFFEAHRAVLTLSFRFTLFNPRGHAVVQLEDEVQGPGSYATEPDLVDATRSVLEQVLKRIAAALDKAQPWRTEVP